MAVTKIGFDELFSWCLDNEIEIAIRKDTFRYGDSHGMWVCRFSHRDSFEIIHQIEIRDTRDIEGLMDHIQNRMSQIYTQLTMKKPRKQK